MNEVDGITVEESVTKARLHEVAEGLVCDGEDVWFNEDRKISVEKTKAALDALEAGADRVEFDQITFVNDERHDSEQAIFFKDGDRSRATNIGTTENRTGLRGLIELFE